jgi:hypothetical protein
VKVGEIIMNKDDLFSEVFEKALLGSDISTRRSAIKLVAELDQIELEFIAELIDGWLNNGDLIFSLLVEIVQELDLLCPDNAEKLVKLIGAEFVIPVSNTSEHEAEFELPDLAETIAVLRVE